MRFAVVAVIVAVSILVGCTNLIVSASDEEKGVIHIAGKVLCQDCTKGWNEWLLGSNPIKGSKVSVTCLDERSRVMYYTSDTTDERGEYELKVNKFVYGKKLEAKLCSVRLVSSPDYACNILTDFGGGSTGVNLIRPTSIYRDTIKFVLNPFYYTTPMCDKPDTSDAQQPRY